MSKRTLATIFVAGVLLLPLLSSAQSASGTLAVTATLQSSISMVFNSNAGGVTLGGAGTNAATLNFGNISAYGTLAANVSRTVGASSFTVSTPFNVEVDKANSSSANYSLTAQLASADAVNTWALNGTGITNASATAVATTGTYGGTGTAYTLALTVPTSNTAASISNTIDFVATAN
jgi:hypothetical protein